jgi:hypothetical protein
MDISQRANTGWRSVILCGAVATALGLGYMAAAAAPNTYLAINAAAFVIGLAIVAIASQLRLPVSAGAICLGLAAVLLVCFLLGTGVNGATRWLRLGNIIVQPSLILVPVLALSFAHDRRSLGVVAVAITALVLALQPDRAMAAALAAGLVTLALVRPASETFTAAAAAVAGFATAMFRPDTQGAMPFVDRIYSTSFEVHPLAGVAVLSGSLILLLPTVSGPRGNQSELGASAVFGAVWVAIVAAAALGNYPTPLVGYGGSAILGYLLCSLSFRTRCAAAKQSGDRAHPQERVEDGGGSMLRPI